MNGYDPKTALLVVDVQNDFADPKGSLHVSGAHEILPVVNRELEHARRESALIVYTQDWHPHTTPHFRKDGGIWPVHCVKHSWGAELHPALHRVRSATVILKGRGGEDGYSGFSSRDPVSGAPGRTGLHDVLRKHRIERVVIAGLTTDYCVKETALDALDAGYDVTVLYDAIRAVNLRPDDGERALAEVSRRGGRVMESAALHDRPRRHAGG
jgi:nicotinamidase/pyrazinamidase